MVDQCSLKGHDIVFPRTLQKHIGNGKNGPLSTRSSLTNTNHAIQSPTCFSPVVPTNDPVRVEHGDELEDKGLPQTLGHRVTAAQKLQGALHHPAGIGLAGMDAAC